MSRPSAQTFIIVGLLLFFLLLFWLVCFFPRMKILLIPYRVSFLDLKHFRILLLIPGDLWLFLCHLFLLLEICNSILDQILLISGDLQPFCINFYLFPEAYNFLMPLLLIPGELWLFCGDLSLFFLHEILLSHPNSIIIFRELQMVRTQPVLPQLVSSRIPFYSEQANFVV